MKATQLPIAMPRCAPGKVLDSVYKPFFESGLSCLRTLDEAPPLTHKVPPAEHRQVFPTLGAERSPLRRKAMVTLV